MNSNAAEECPALSDGLGVLPEVLTVAAYNAGNDVMIEAVKQTAGPELPPCDMEGASAQGYPYPEAGMTLRDYFAAKAMQSVLRDPYFSEKADTMGHSEFADEVAEAAYTVADAMLRFRAA